MKESIQCERKGRKGWWGWDGFWGFDMWIEGRGVEGGFVCGLYYIKNLSVGFDLIFSWYPRRHEGAAGGNVLVRSMNLKTNECLTPPWKVRIVIWSYYTSSRWNEKKTSRAEVGHCLRTKQTREIFYLLQHLSFFHALFHNDWLLFDLLFPHRPHVKSQATCCFSHHPTAMATKMATDGITIAIMSPESSLPSSFERFTTEGLVSATLVWNEAVLLSFHR